MFAQKYSSGEGQANSWWSGWWFGTDTWVLYLNIDPPDCSGAGNTYYCLAGWGDNTGYPLSTGGIILGNQANYTNAGAWTGGASMRRTLAQVVSFCDGHVAIKTPGALAAGTNYQSTGLASGQNPPAQQASALLMTNMSIEHYYGVE